MRVDVRLNSKSSYWDSRGVRLRLPTILLYFIITCTLTVAGLSAQNVGVQVEDAYTRAGEQGYVRFLCNTNVPLAALIVPVKLESNDLILDSVVFSSLVPSGSFNLNSQLSESRRRGFVQVLPLLSGSPATFYAYDEEIFRIYYRVKLNADEGEIPVDTFYNRFYDAGHWITDEIQASDGLGRSIFPDFQAGSIWTDQTTNVDDEVALVPSEFALEQNFPNPFNPSTTITFTVPSSGRVSLEVYNILGRKVETLLDEQVESGLHSVVWSAENAPSAMYFYKLSYSGGSILRKMAIVK